MSGEGEEEYPPPSSRWEMFSSPSFGDALRPANPPGDELLEVEKRPDQLNLQSIISTAYWWVYDKMMASSNISSTDIAIIMESLYEVRDRINQMILESGMEKERRESLIIWHSVVFEGVCNQLLVHVSRSERGWLLRLLSGIGLGGRSAVGGGAGEERGLSAMAKILGVRR